MPVTYHSWEMASGATVAYNMASRGNNCAVAESSKGSTFPNFRVQDSLSRGSSSGGESPRGSNCWAPSAQDTVVRGFSTLSLCGQPLAETDLCSEENRSSFLGKLRCASPELSRCMSPRTNESSAFTFSSPASCRRPLVSHNSVYSVGFVSSSEMCDRASVSSSVRFNLDNDLEYTSDREGPSMAHSSLLLRRNLPSMNFDVSKEDGIHNFPSTSWNSNSLSTVVTEDAKFDLEPDTISASSISSGNDVRPENASSGENSQLLDDTDTEAESAFKGSTDLSCSLGASSLSRKGLSRFYAGKARSFSCLRDVASVKDLAKPENPYAKKRRVMSGGTDCPRLPPLQKGATSICKKPLHNGKSTLALAVAMSTKEEQESVVSSGASRCLVPSRSSSLSDLQGATRSIFFVG